MVDQWRSQEWKKSTYHNIKNYNSISWKSVKNVTFDLLCNMAIPGEHIIPIKIKLQWYFHIRQKLLLQWAYGELQSHFGLDR